MDKQSRFLADILTSHIYTVMSMFVSFEEQFEKICSGPLFCCSKIKLRQVAKNKVPHIRDILPEVFLILQQVSYEHLKKRPALLALILPVPQNPFAQVICVLMSKSTKHHYET